MEIKHLKPKFGRWLTIDELRAFLTETPEDVFQQVPINRKLLEIASEFVEQQEGWWEHPDWEGFLNRLDRDGFHLSREAEPPIGSILEIFKEYYHREGFQEIVDKRRKPSARKGTRSRAARTSKKGQAANPS